MDIERQRNIAFVGPHHAGKTTLVEAALAYSGAIGRRGSIADGTTVTDHEPEDVSHAQSTTVGFAHCTSGAVDVTIVDAPGFIDFFEETKFALCGADGAVIVVEADPARVVQTKSLVDYLETRKMPHCFVINKLDRPGADFEATLGALQALYGRHVVAEQWPIFTRSAANEKSSGFSGYVDLADMKTYAFDTEREREGTIPAELLERVRAAHGELLEAMADFDDHLMEELLEGIEPPLDEVERDLCSECSHDQIVPVLVAAGAAGAGVPALLRALERWFPSPADAPALDAEGRPIPADPNGPVIAYVIKTIIHPQSGKLSLVRVISGTLKSDATLTDISQNNEKVRSGGLYRLQGKKQEPIPEAGPGAIVGIARLEPVKTGDVLASNGHKVLLPRVPPSEPCFAIAVRPKERIDEAKIFQMLARIVDEDPSLRLTRAEITAELLLLGSGEQHVAIAVERLARKYKVEVETAAPQIPYQETISAGTELHSRYKHQTGGHGQFGDVWLRFEPRERGSGVTFEDKIVGGVVPRQFIPAVEKGVREALAHGPNGYPVTDMHVTLFDGQYHDVDSSEQSFKTAAGMGVREALPKCNPVVLEPISRVAVTVPTQYTSTVIQQLTGKRGQILGMNPAEQAGFDVIEADVPQVELSRYITELRTGTQGLGTFGARHERYDPVQGNKVGPRAAV
ncbi:MAG TPA: elongation factor G [Candidatus Acidoferrum sp.]|jgi:elongation factor G|nr:elongation factor G [Candidatus Acidoferrum sp.]